MTDDVAQRSLDKQKCREGRGHGLSGGSHTHDSLQKTGVCVLFETKHHRSFPNLNHVGFFWLKINQISRMFWALYLTKVTKRTCCASGKASDAKKVPCASGYGAKGA